MDKRLAGMILAAGVSAGALGTKVVEAVASDRAVYIAHAWDVRRIVQPSADGGTPNIDYAVEAWFAKQLPDGGLEYPGKGEKCILDQLILSNQAQELVERCGPQPR